MQYLIKVFAPVIFLFLSNITVLSFESDNVNGSRSNKNFFRTEGLGQKDKSALPVNGQDSALMIDGSQDLVVELPAVAKVVIPSLDFGMEFLYRKKKDPVEDILPERNDSSLQIRGTIKHRF
ncbi:MAG: hypothetical protein HRT83_04305 [Hyphomicrobiaceae bacterium]|nr:hypothetical protein [Hyphomicrobiaceae bacterium]